MAKKTTVQAGKNRPATEKLPTRSANSSERSTTRVPEQQVAPPVAKKTHPLTAPAIDHAPTQSAMAKAGARTSIETRDVRQRLEVEIQQALVRHFNYPLLARKRGWQGEVVLAFRLESDGRILDARIARSSGHGILDSAALKALAKVERLEHETAHSFTLQIPVIYRLEG